jgi:hypothetical protein
MKIFGNSAKGSISIYCSWFKSGRKKIKYRVKVKVK